jgi:addiction module HigA family antidote
MGAEYIVNRARITRAPIHLGVIFAEEVMPELRKSRTIVDIAALLKVSRSILYLVMAGEVAVSPDMAVRLCKLCGNGPNLWLNLQAAYDAWEASRRLRKEIRSIPTLR